MGRIDWHPVTNEMSQEDTSQLRFQEPPLSICPIIQGHTQSMSNRFYRQLRGEVRKNRNKNEKE